MTPTQRLKKLLQLFKSRDDNRRETAMRVPPAEYAVKSTPKHKR